jgi:hypothetical protein
VSVRCDVGELVADVITGVFNNVEGAEAVRPRAWPAGDFMAEPVEIAGNTNTLLLRNGEGSVG